MSLDWNVTKVKDWEDIKDGDNWAITQCLIFDMLGNGYWEVTEKNWADVYARSVERKGEPIMDHGEPRNFTPEEIHRRIGLSTNVGADETEAKWLRRNDRRRKELLAQYRANAIATMEEENNA